MDTLLGAVTARDANADVRFLRNLVGTQLLRAASDDDDAPDRTDEERLRTRTRDDLVHALRRWYADDGVDLGALCAHLHAVNVLFRDVMRTTIHPPLTCVDLGAPALPPPRGEKRKRHDDTDWATGVNSGGESAEEGGGLGPMLARLDVGAAAKWEADAAARRTMVAVRRTRRRVRFM